MGRPGATAQRYANFTQQNADWLLVLGARLDLGQTAYNHRNFAKSAKIFVVEIDPAELNKLDMSLAGSICVSVKDFLQEFLKQKKSVQSIDPSVWLERCRQWKTKYPVILPEYFQDRPGVNTYALIETLSRQMDADDLLIPGSSGACSELTMQTFKVRDGMRVFNSPGLGSMGFGIPASIGGCIASGGRRTVCIDGDGGVQMNIQELETVKRLKLPIKLFVLNNDGYGSIRATQNGYFAGRYVGSDPSSGLTLPSTIKIARAYGIPSVSIRHRKHLNEKVAQVLTMAGPVICDVKIYPNQVVAPRISSIQKEDGTMESRPMEDLWPFLDREEFRDNMAV
jgi:acetolactate synthase-1/2/3 large subunit